MIKSNRGMAELRKSIQKIVKKSINLIKKEPILGGVFSDSKPVGLNVIKI